MSGSSDASPRYEVRAPVVYRGTDLQGGGKIANMSTSGALIEPASCAVSPGTPLRILISYSPDKTEPRSLELASQVVRTTESGFAVAFRGAQTRIHPAAVSSTPTELCRPQSRSDGNTERQQARRQQKRTGQIKAKIEPALSAKRPFIYDCASRTVKNSLTSSFSRSKRPGSSGLRGLGISTCTCLKIRAGFVLIM